MKDQKQSQSSANNKLASSMSEGRKRTRSSTNNNLTSEMSEGRKRTRRSTKNDQPTDFIHHSQQKCLFLTEDNKVVKFGEKKISVKEYQQAEGIVWNTWVDYFFPKDKSHGNHLVTLTQKSGNTFRVLTKDTLKDTLKSVSYKMENHRGANREHPPNTIQEVGKNLEHHLFVMHTKASGKSMLQCYKSKTHFLHVSNKRLVLDRAANSNETEYLECITYTPPSYTSYFNNNAIQQVPYLEENPTNNVNSPLCELQTHL